MRPETGFSEYWRSLDGPAKSRLAADITIAWDKLQASCSQVDAPYMLDALEHVAELPSGVRGGDHE